MSLLFRTNASRREKMFTLLVLCLVMLAIYGMKTSFVPEPWLKSLSTYLAFPVALFFFIPLFRDRHPSNKVPALGMFKRTLFYTFLLGIFYGFAWLGLALGSASLVTHAFWQERMGEFTVAAKSDGSWQRRDCDYSITIEELGSTWQAKTCITENNWRSVQRGDKLKAKVKFSSLGGFVAELDHL